MDAWTRHMRRGDFESAWRICDGHLADAALRDPGRPRHLQSVWDGAPLSGRRVLVRCYHGLGDTIQFIRYAPLLAEVAAEVIVWAQPPLLPLLGSARGIHRLLPLDDGAPPSGHDASVEVMELPHVFRSTLATLPRAVPYLRAAPAPVASRGLAVGVAWRAGGWDSRRDLPFALARRLSRVPGVEAWSLQKERRAGEDARTLRWSTLARTVSGTARLVRALDLVITVDSMPAHLAGALGVPVWTLLSHAPDWRWLSGREDSPWYPTMRLFRQKRAGIWDPVVARVEEELARLVGEGAEASVPSLSGRAAQRPARSPSPRIRCRP